MFDHLEGLALSAIFNPVFLAFLVGIYIGGRILGSFMPWRSIVKPMVIFYCIGLPIKLFIFTAGYDLYIMFGFPFMAGLWGGARK